METELTIMSFVLYGIGLDAAGSAAWQLDHRRVPLAAGVVRNLTQFPLARRNPSSDYWYAGAYDESPPAAVARFSVGTFTAVSNSWFSGVGGGNAWALDIDPDNSIEFDIALGFEVPYNSWTYSNEAGVTESKAAEDGYKQASPKDVTIYSNDI